DTTVNGRVYALIAWRSIRRAFLPGAEGRADLGAQQSVQESGVTLVDKQLMLPAFSAWAGAVPAPPELQARGATGSGFRGRAFLGGGSIVVIGCWKGASEGHVGATTEVAGIATFLVGMLAGAGHLLIAGVIGLVVASLLVAKPKLEAISRAMSPREVTAVLEL